MITLVKFYADWCAPCKAVAPAVDELVEEMKNELVLTSVNIDNDPQLRQEHFVRSIPTFLLFKNGVEIGRRIGGGTKNDLKEWVNECRGIQSEVLPEPS